MRTEAVRHMTLVRELPAEVKRNLTFQLDNPVTDEIREFYGYEITEEGIWLPRAYKLEWLSQLEDAGWERVEIPFKGKLKPHQAILANKFLNSKYKNGIISANTGSGKTVLALYLASQLGLKTLVVTHTERIFEQWKKRIQDFCGIKPSFIRSSYCDYSAPITVAMLQTLALSKYVDREALYKQFGFVIYDEVHRMPTEKFSRVATMFWDKYRLGLSATVKRKDGLHKLLLYHLGELFKYDVEPSVIPNVLTIFFTPHRATLSVDTSRAGKPLLARYLNKLAKLDERNMLIASLIHSAYRKDRYVIVLSDRLAMLSRISTYLKRLKIPHGWITGERVKDIDRNILLATYGAAGEGLDIPELDMLILATPRADIRQAIGRVLRPKKKRPIVVDIVDIVDTGSKIIKNIYKKRCMTYKALKCMVITKYVSGLDAINRFHRLEAESEKT